MKQWKESSDHLFLISRDGSIGLRGHVYNNIPDILRGLPVHPDLVIANGCNYQMKRTCDATRPINIKTLVSLNTLMIDGTGMCGVCRVSIDEKMKFACVDGPYFDGHSVDWDELAKRRRSYLPEEAVPFHSSRAERIPPSTIQ
jgi:ferredoxin--NADP+ reductase